MHRHVTGASSRSTATFGDWHADTTEAASAAANPSLTHRRDPSASTLVTSNPWCLHRGPCGPAILTSGECCAVVGRRVPWRARGQRLFGRVRCWTSSVAIPLLGTGKCRLVDRHFGCRCLHRRCPRTSSSSSRRHTLDASHPLGGGSGLRRRPPAKETGDSGCHARGEPELHEGAQARAPLRGRRSSNEPQPTNHPVIGKTAYEHATLGVGHRPPGPPKRPRQRPASTRRLQHPPKKGGTFASSRSEHASLAPGRPLQDPLSRRPHA